MVTQLAIGEDAVSVMMIDAFSAAPLWSSRIPGLGGPKAAGDPSYVFRSAPTPFGLGRIVFTVRFHDLQATSGALVLQVATVSAYPGAPQAPLTTIVTAMADLAGEGGVKRIEFIGRRNMLYALAGNIYDETDATASAISITLDQGGAFDAPPEAHGAFLRETNAIARGDTGMHASALLLAQEPPSLLGPVSQAATWEQCDQAPFAEWMAALRRPAEPTPENWELAYILQSLRRYGGLRPGTSGLGFGERGKPLPALLAAMGCSVLVAAGQDAELPGSDPGLALEQLSQPELCPPDRFYRHVHFTTMDMSDIPHGLGDFDFLWSLGVADRLPTVDAFLKFVERSMDCLKSGGVAVHVLRLGNIHGRFGDGRLALVRAEVERIALSLVSRGHQLAQLKFLQSHAKKGRQTAAIPFGLIARRR